jgi:serine protease inhibitor
MRRSRTRSSITVIRPLPWALVLLVAACGDPSGPGDDPTPITELPRDLSASEVAVIADANAFGFDLMKALLEKDGRPNIVLSPLSASMALGMTLNGARSQTFEEMRSALRFAALSQEEINDAYRGLIDLLTELDPEVRFDIANSIWARLGVPIEPAFLEVVREAFDARTETRDFSDPSTVNEINRWVRESTEGLIDGIVDSLDPTVVMLLVNAIYFDGAWSTRFEPEDTHQGEFTRSDGSTVTVDMMSLEGVELPLDGGQGYAAVELPYGGGAYSMVIAVPHPGVDVRDFLRTLDSGGWAALVAGLTPTKVDLVSIPRFVLSYDAYLNDALKAMGMEGAFEPGADFTGLSQLGDQMCIDFVRQKTFIEVDERGTRAAAVTGVGVGATSFLGVVADRPFAFALRERLSGTILFMGTVGDPTSDDPGPDPYVDTCE